MISQFIDGLVHYHFLQNALITAVAIGVVAGGDWLFYYFAGNVIDGRCHFSRRTSGVALSYILGVNFLSEQFSLVFLHRSLSPISLTIV